MQISSSRVDCYPSPVCAMQSSDAQDKENWGESISTFQANNSLGKPLALTMKRLRSQDVPSQTADFESFKRLKLNNFFSATDGEGANIHSYTYSKYKTFCSQDECVSSLNDTWEDNTDCASVVYSSSYDSPNSDAFPRFTDQTRLLSNKRPINLSDSPLLFCPISEGYVEANSGSNLENLATVRARLVGDRTDDEDYSDRMDTKEPKLWPMPLYSTKKNSSVTVCRAAVNNSLSGLESEQGQLFCSFCKDVVAKNVSIKISEKSMDVERTQVDNSTPTNREVQLHKPLKSSCSCSFCDKVLCCKDIISDLKVSMHRENKQAYCAVECSVCLASFCSLCSTTDYSQQFERTLCLDCSLGLCSM